MAQTSAAVAQGVDALSQQLDRLERDLQILQRDVYREGAAGSEGGAVPNAPFQANLVVRMGEMENQLTELRGMVEEATHRQTLLNKRIEGIEQGLVPRIIALEQAQIIEPPVIGGAPDTAEEKTEPSDSVKVNGKEVPISSTEKAPAPKPEVKPQPTGVVPKFSSPREHYNSAFSLLQEEKYSAAAESFETFIETYHDDPLLGNVYYWLGETHYVREDYKRAANEFRKGFQAASDGPKAPDNLLKLALSLERLEKPKEACVVLKQLDKKFGKQSSAALKKGEQARDRLNCS